MTWRHADARRVQKTFDTKGFPSMTQQHFKEECDINAIMRRFERQGVVDHLAKFQGSYGDFTQAPQSYEEAMSQITKATEMFMSLPAAIRARFGHDPGAFVDFVSNRENIDELRKLGLARPERTIAKQKEPAGDVDGSSDPSPAAADASGEA